MAVRGVLPAPVFWGIVAATLGVGVGSIPSIGWLLILFAVLLAMLAPLRTEPRSFWPLAAGLVVFTVGYLLAAPFGCTQGAVAEAGGEQRTWTFCESVAGIRYERAGTENPSQLPAFGAALGGGILVSAALRLVLGRA
jgi:hypothetical protein